MTFEKLKVLRRVALPWIIQLTHNHCHKFWAKKGEFHLHIICCVLKRYFREKKFENNRNKIF